MPTLNNPGRYEILHDPRYNKGTAFTLAERDALGITGLLPEAVDTLEIQVARVRTQLAAVSEDLQKYLFLSDLQGRNATLFYALLMSSPATFMPLVYTPTVGEACQKFGHIFRGPKGLYLPITGGHLKERLLHWPEKDVRFIVVTDGERILGLGDLGVGGMGIPIGKLSLYTACAGVPPRFTLPITLDVGTNNEALLEDPLYLGLRQHRVRGERYSAFIDEFVTSIQQLYPTCCIQWEDFANFNAVAILQRYQDQVCTFNDDIQGTAAIALAGIYGALRISRQKLTDQRFLFLGAGSAATGIAELFGQALRLEGLSIKEGRARSWLFNTKGLVVTSRTDLRDFQKPFAHEHPPIASFIEAVETIKPTCIIGLSTIPKLFNQKVIEAMSRINERPIIFPYSNPTSRSECTAEEAYQWSNGKAIFAAGSPFDPVHFGDRTFIPGQGNNVYIFPALGMAILATQAKRVTQAVFIVAAKAVAEQVTQEQLDSGLIYPHQSQIYEASIHVAVKAAERIFADDQAGIGRPEDLEAHIRAWAYHPEYPLYAS
jgi:malate dehydrogenase (oxaloacetate-decarboxylating)(NADP+)